MVAGLCDISGCCLARLAASTWRGCLHAEVGGRLLLLSAWRGLRCLPLAFVLLSSGTPLASVATGSSAFLFLPCRLSANMSKRKRTDLRSFGGISDSKLCELFAKIKADPSLRRDCPDSRYQMHRLDERIYSDQLRLDVELRTTKGRTYIWHTADPLRLMRYYCKSTQAFLSLLDEVSRPLPGDHVYATIVYYDEVTPGALLRLDNCRTFWTF